MSEQKEGRSIDSIRHEYSDSSQNARHYSNLRFAIFSVYFAVTAGITVIAFNNDQRFTPYITYFAKIGGLLLTLVFWSYQERASQMAIHFAKVAAQLEPSLGYSQFSTRPPNRFPMYEAKYVTRIFFAFLTAFWAHTIYGAVVNP